jgi:hypothetical protein
MATALDIIQGGYLNINSYSPGVALGAQETAVGLAVLNDLLESLSTDKCYVYTQQENVFVWIANQYLYTVGNYTGGTFTGTLTSGSPTITGVTVPASIVANATATLASDITDLQGLVPAGTTIVSVGATTVTMSANATANSSGLDTFTYTIPGNIKMARPLRFNNGFTRTTASGISNLDYSFSFISFDRYKEELLKNVQGPWPYVAAWQPTFPLGNLYVYPAPGASYTAHLFTDLILPSFATATAAYSLPQGYTRSLKKLLALELAPIYGKTPSPLLISQAREAKDLLKALNDSPVVALRFDSAIARAQTADAGWIMTGGFH